MKTYKDNPNKKVYNIDFDGTLTDGSYSNPKPVHKIITKVTNLFYQGHVVIIWTARQWVDAKYIAAWLIRWDIPYHGIMMGKGGSDYYVDDKAMPIDKFMSE